MKAVRAEKIDGIDDYEMVEVATPTPAMDGVLIEVHACGMGYVDALVALGGYQVKPPVPFTPGLEIAGRVAALGSGVSRLNPGDRVMAYGFGGGLAQYALAPNSSTWIIPKSLSFAEAAALRTNYLTAYHGLRDRAALKPRERLLVFGASGGVGSAAVQLGRLMGAEVIAVASTEEKREFALATGAHHALDTNLASWRDRLKAICDGVGPDVVFDPVCGHLMEPAFRSQVWGGRYLVVGFVGGPIAKLPVNLPLMKGASLIGVDVRQFVEFERERADAHIAELLRWAADGRLTPVVGRRFPFSQFKDAMNFALSGKGIGRTVIDVVSD
ncbi:NADPH:quinone oxidoreductase family protein [Bradyrhizobium liaoningense]|uniref:NADPH:quinone oxidoreductase family protein n=1 Tax=Bradyrhizobium liaoningense TaxID=43992 RepID=UPI001BAB4EA4|nr:NADPH:quinone oxidoreductase family protein [Bradyrhizobium liaoningense]MBR0905168.1 NADPH:quinone oxidoreductase family protein [Bradyrhizobium liaoningense]